MRAPEVRRFLSLFIASLVLAGCASDGDRGGRDGLSVAPRRTVHASADERARRDASLATYQAGRAAEEGRLDEALRLARRAVGIDPQSLEALAVLGIIQERSGDVEVAGETYKRALMLAPSNVDAVNNYGSWLCSQGQAAEALVVLDRALATTEGKHSPGLLANAGTCALHAGQVVRAEQDLRAALVLDPGHTQALKDMARVLAGRNEWMGARAFYQRRLAAAPADVSVLQLAIEIEQGLGDMKAAEHYRQLLQLHP